MRKSNSTFLQTLIFIKKKSMIFSKTNLFKLKKALLSLSETHTDEGVNLIIDGDLEVGKEVFVEGEDGLEPVSDGIYTHDNELIEVEGGIVKSITEKEVEQPVEEPVTEEVVEKPETEEVVEEVVEEPVNEEPVEEVVEEPIVEEPTVDELNEIINEQKSVIEGLKSENEELKAENEELKKKLEEPAAFSAEEEFRKETVEVENKIDFSKYIKRNKK